MLAKFPWKSFSFLDNMKILHQDIIIIILLILYATLLCDSQNDDIETMKKLQMKLNAKGWNGQDPSKWPGVRYEGNGITCISIKDQNLSVPIPEELNNLTALKILRFMNTNLTGALPSFTGLGTLTELRINGNQFSSIPNDFFAAMPQLQFVDIGNNPFKDFELEKMSISLVNVKSLQFFSAVQAKITGRVPGFLNTQTFAGLQTVQLSYNNLTGELPAEFSGSQVQRLWLNNNNLKGSLAVVGNMTKLGELWVNMNQFTGPLPEFNNWEGEGHLNFNFRDNRLTGPVPDSFVKLTGLNTVKLTNNHFQGAMPKFPDGVQEVDNLPETNRFCSNISGQPCDPLIDTLLSIVKDMGYPFRLADSWKGNNPCSNWLGIVCDAISKNIIVINFKGMGLSGTISPSFANLTSLQRILLANNALTGTIPDNIATLPSITELDVSNNKLYGKVPTFVGRKVRVNTDGNPGIGKYIPSPGPGGDASGKNNSNIGAPSFSPGPGGDASGKNKPNIGAPSFSPRGDASGENKLIIGAIVGGVVGGVCVVGLIFWCIRSRKRHGGGENPTPIVVHPRPSGDENALKISVTPVANGGSGTASNLNSGSSDVHLIEAGNMVISIQVLRNVTNNFSDENILGKGGFGTVYKGELHDGTKIAVKRMESGTLTEHGLHEFKSEIAVLTKVRHRHLVSLLGYCLEGNERILIYEYMPQGTLSRHLFNWKEEGLAPLEWKKRLGIALDVGRGVEYLHGLAHQSFIHRDLKPSNILLGDDMRAKVADFGLVRLAPDGKTSIETRLAGTFGYLAPEYAATGRVTTKIDVFSFGVILMELITGRKALDETQPEESLHLVTWFRRMHINKDALWKATDSTIELNEETQASLSTVAELAGHCTTRDPCQRPDMGHVVNVISSLVEKWKPANLESEEFDGINYDVSLSQAIKRWQATEGNSCLDDSLCSRASYDTEKSTPNRPPGFAATFTSTDGR